MKIDEASVADMDAVRSLFVRVNRLLAPPHLQHAFEAYIARALAEELNNPTEYYALGGFWVAREDDRIVGMFGLEPVGEDGMELRRMYVDPDFRRRGIARSMLFFAEEECRRRGIVRLDLSTSELQTEALTLYRQSGYTTVGEKIAQEASNKQVGAGLRRFYFSKVL